VLNVLGTAGVLPVTERDSDLVDYVFEHLLEQWAEEVEKIVSRRDGGVSPRLKIAVIEEPK
jgi:hypothetical protein